MDKEIKTYLSSVKRRLNLPREIRSRLLSDLETTIAARMEQGESWPDIRENLGSAAQVAAEYTQQMKEFAYRKSPWRFAALAVAVLCGARFVYEWALRLAAELYLQTRNASMGIIGGADGPTAVFITSSPPPAFKLGMVAVIFVLAIVCYLRLRKCKQK